MEKFVIEQFIDSLPNRFKNAIPSSCKEEIKEAKQNEKRNIALFMRWFIKHYSTATIDGMFGWVDSMGKEVTIIEILNEYYYEDTTHQ